MRSRRTAGPKPYTESHFDKYSGLLEYVKKEGAVYLASHPGQHNLRNNRDLHIEIQNILRGYLLPVRKLEQLREQIDYRMIHVVRLATDYKNALGIDFPDCDEISPDALRRTEAIFRLVWEYPLFDSTLIRGPEYSKGRQYIVACIHQAGWTLEEAAEKLADLVRYKGRKGADPNTISSSTNTY